AVHHGDGAAQEGHVLDEPLADLGMPTHGRPLLLGEPARLEEDGVGNADLADVVQEHAVGEVGQVLRRHSVLAGGGQRVAVHASRVRGAGGAPAAGGRGGRPVAAGGPRWVRGGGAWGGARWRVPSPPRRSSSAWY